MPIRSVVQNDRRRPKGHQQVELGREYDGPDALQYSLHNRVQVPGRDHARPQHAVGHIQAVRLESPHLDLMILHHLRRKNPIQARPAALDPAGRPAGYSVAVGAESRGRRNGLGAGRDQRRGIRGSGVGIGVPAPGKSRSCGAVPTSWPRLPLSEQGGG